ncbi:hypothetical protein ROZALSC1DRAFT_30211 [Rozella allomycis CSF55]|uniref:Uncharacterized protein n=1 Tax=Rozella allomycis (strain CSF55) TaxID=988480 RepID=A0A4P9YFM6_ROZAC|nr:hypothetical protein ROZALSC1DRAFT_30211 [Rozella allomycis CSF55]
MKRESWMLEPPKGGLFKDRNDNQQKIEKPPAPVQTVREMNPFLNPSVQKRPENYDNKPSLSWQAKKIQRTIELAQETGKSLLEVAEDRFGSYEEFLKLREMIEVSKMKPSGKKITEEKGKKVDNLKLNKDEDPAILEKREKIRLLEEELKSARKDRRKAAVERIEYQIQILKEDINEYKKKKTFTNPDDMDIQTMLQMERAESRHKMDRDFLSMSSKVKRNNDDTFDEIQETRNKKLKNKEKKIDMNEERARVLSKEQKTIEACPFCLESSFFDNSLVLATALKSFISIPKTGALHPLQLQIVPIEHIPSMLHGDEDLWDEIRNFKKCIIRMLASRGFTVVFLETCIKFNKLPHTVIDAIPLPGDCINQVKGYFKKAINEIGSEWSQNKKLVDTFEKGLRRSVPKEFPYFYVDFKLDTGYAHVIEKEESFSIDFGKSVVGQLLGLDATQWRDNAAVIKDDLILDKRISILKKTYPEYDWTHMLNDQ